jgi:hypothetical protein
MKRQLLLQPLQCLRLRRWLARFRWQRWLLRWRRWQPLWRLQLWSSLWLPLPELRLVLSQLPSVVLGSQVCPRPVPLWPVRFALRWLLLLPCLQLQQPLLLLLPDRTLCRQLSFRYSLPLWSQRWLRLLLQPLQCLRQQRWLARFRWLLSQLRSRR